jgi:hypothetical protein
MRLGDAPLHRPPSPLYLSVLVHPLLPEQVNVESGCLLVMLIKRVEPVVNLWFEFYLSPIHNTDGRYSVRKRHVARVAAVVMVMQRIVGLNSDFSIQFSIEITIQMEKR